ncbi:30S ribosomal protein S17 [Candidatus Woesearchaeota archaeon]|nr:30S ribosomal protein S17 [Candidatus Woesearchaeota archaeon]
MKNTSTRGRTFTGIVTSGKMRRTVTVAWTRRYYLPKYERYEKRRTKVKAHNPDVIDARVGDTVTVMETRPLSKTKHFTIIKKHEAVASVDAVTKEDVQEAVKEASAEEEPQAEEPAKKRRKPTKRKTTKKKAAKKKAKKKATRTTKK